jgi:glycosyltransferase involved in cell wall biosynthesis
MQETEVLMQCAGQAPRTLLHVFPSFATGGVQVRFAAIANRFGRLWRHAIIAMDGDLACAGRLDPSLDVVFPSVELPRNNTLGNIRRCREAIRSIAPSTLVTSNWGTIEWALANLLPLVRHVHVEDGLGPDEVGGQYGRRIWARRLALRRSTVVLPSFGLMRMAREIWRLPSRRLRFIPNGVDLTRFDVSAARSAACPVIGTVAALRVEKNIGRMLKAFQIVRAARPARLVIVGDGPERPALGALAVELGIAGDVRFAGHTPHPEREYADFDIFALSSDTEQMPLSVLEGMAARLPVVATDVGDVRQMLAATNERFVVARDAGALATALLALIDAPDLRGDIGRANREKAVREYDQERMFSAWAAVFDGATVKSD